MTRPGRVNIVRDRLNLLDALGQAGDLTIQGRRDNVKVIREENGESKAYFVDLRSKDLFNSPVYSLQRARGPINQQRQQRTFHLHLAICQLCTHQFGYLDFQISKEP